MKRYILLIVLFSLLWSPGSALGSREMFLEAMESYSNEEYGQAVIEFKEVIDAGGEYVFDAYHYKILSLFQLQDFQRARRATDTLIKLGYDSPIINLEWGKIYMNVDGLWDQADIERAKEALVRAEDQGLSTGTLYGLLGDVYEYLGEMDTSLSYYQKALSKDPLNAIYHNSIARIYQSLDMLDRAIFHMEWSMGIDPHQPGLMVVLANIYYEKEMIHEFKETYRRAILLHPQRFSFRQEYGIRLYEMGFFDEAREELIEGMKLNPNTYLPYYYLGLIYRERGDVKKATEYLEKALYYNPQYTDAILVLGDLLLEESPFRALSYYYEAKELSPLYAPVYYAIGLAYYELGFLSTAIENLQQALRIDPYYEKPRELLEEIQ